MDTYSCSSDLKRKCSVSLLILRVAFHLNFVFRFEAEVLDSKAMFLEFRVRFRTSFQAQISARAIPPILKNKILSCFFLSITCFSLQPFIIVFNRLLPLLFLLSIYATRIESRLKLSVNMSGEEEENAAELKIGDEFLKAKCLMNCEVSLILEHKYEQLQQMSEDPMNQVSQVFEKSLQYVKRFSRYKNPDAVRQVRELLSRYQLAEFELCVLGNLCPETVEEAIAMVPSIKSRGRGHDDEAIEKMLNDMSLIKKFE
ncbi:hypothetical protein SSX86_032642 [Deinandra increscens subsp. villosa]